MIKIQKPKVSVIIPTLNESDTIPIVLAGVLKLKEVDEVIVVDGGSVDATPELAERNGAKVIIKKRAGWGTAVKTGLQFATNDYIVILDADATYNPVDILKLIQVLTLYKDVAVVLGSRPEKSFSNRILSLVFRLLFNRPITDLTSSFLATRSSIIKDSDFSSQGFDLKIEILGTIAKRGLRVVEVPVSYRKRLGYSKLNPFLDGFRIFRKILRLWFRYST